MDEHSLFFDCGRWKQHKETLGPNPQMAQYAKRFLSCASKSAIGTIANVHDLTVFRYASKWLNQPTLAMASPSLTNNQAGWSPLLKHDVFNFFSSALNPIGPIGPTVLSALSAPTVLWSSKIHTKSFRLEYTSKLCIRYQIKQNTYNPNCG